ncbi:ParB/RepB/Spo0J family partition protein [uncultured Tateyamaria sp.]|uniref:ParB/RepB/Spo0J family partition protein n=1 Tax=uncultured Tateyamaria sp. TaxID=455651 RepID=UPI002610DFF2|nr:ParB/RepB/Spo0J family partition protein [uncultured Tateyamaria sp.]
MAVLLSLIDPNPYRDFDNYPIDQDAVAVLVTSINETGFWGGVSGRKVGDRFQSAAGHHRIEAARKAGLDHVEMNVRDYSDVQMVAIMADENLTQRGNVVAATLDSVAAITRLVATEVLSGKFPKQTHNRFMSDFWSEGVGRNTILNHPAGKNLKDDGVRAAVATLKASGQMARLILRAAQDVDADAETMAKAQALVDGQPQTYDAQAATAFNVPAHEKAFREAMLTPAAQKHVPVEQHVALAEHVRNSVDKYAGRLGRSGSSLDVMRAASEVVAQAAGIQRDIDHQENEWLLDQRKSEKLKVLCRRVRHSLLEAEGSMQELEKLIKEWPEDQFMQLDQMALFHAQTSHKILGTGLERLRSAEDADEAPIEVNPKQLPKS